MVETLVGVSTISLLANEPTTCRRYCGLTCFLFTAGVGTALAAAAAEKSPAAMPRDFMWP